MKTFSPGFRGIQSTKLTQRQNILFSTLQHLPEHSINFHKLPESLHNLPIPFRAFHNLPQPYTTF